VELIIATLVPMSAAITKTLSPFIIRKAQCVCLSEYSENPAAGIPAAVRSGFSYDGRFLKRADVINSRVYYASTTHESGMWRSYTNGPGCFTGFENQYAELTVALSFPVSDLGLTPPFSLVR
jgi:hypothetical protein